MQYTNGDIIIDAIRWDGQNTSDVLDFISPITIQEYEQFAMVTTTGVKILLGDYITTGDTDITTYAPDVFLQMYYPVNP